MNKLTVIIKPTRDCNLGCKYCSVGDPSPSYMAPEIAEKIIGKITTRHEGSETKWIWHGGEPLLMGLDFYNQIIQFQHPLLKRGYIIDNAIQTNGTLITPEWAKFFRKFDFAVGLSIDGPQYLNDQTRIFRNGMGAFDAIINGSEILDSYKVNHSFLVVLTAHNAKSIDKVINFMVERNKRFKLVAVAPLGRAAERKTELMPQSNDFSDSQIRLFDRWLSEGNECMRDALW